VKQGFVLLCCLALCAIAAQAQKKSSRSTMNDQQFVNFAGQTEMTEANLGQLASTAAASQPIKDFAQKLATDQKTDFHQLFNVAHKEDLKVPTAIDSERNKTTIGPFQKLKGAAFDQSFLKEIIEAETKTIHVYKEEAADAQHPALRSYAEEALPILQTNLAGAKSLEKEKTKAPTKG
jgi:putative membrane protein